MNNNDVISWGLTFWKPKLTKIFPGNNIISRFESANDKKILRE